MILHVDGDGFFASCEILRHPELRGLPVVTGAERGIASAMSYEAKALGITRGMPIFRIRQMFPQVTILESDYELYSLIAERMYDIVRRFSSNVEEYSIDECFAELLLPLRKGEIERGYDSGYGNLAILRRENMRLEGIARTVRDTLESETGVSFSVGIASTKTLAKVASKWAKPHGATFIAESEREKFLDKSPIQNVWGIGRALTERLMRARVLNALEFVSKDEAWIKRYFTKPVLETWLELRGVSVLPVSDKAVVPKSIQKTKTFTPPSSQFGFITSELSKNVENACIKLRRHELLASKVSFFIKTQGFRYRGLDITLVRPTDVAQEMLSAILTRLPEVFSAEHLYRATGVTLSGFVPVTSEIGDLFGTKTEAPLCALSRVMDGLDARYGKHAVFLASSLNSKKGVGMESRRKAPSPLNLDSLFLGETVRRHLRLPHLGIVV